MYVINVRGKSSSMSVVASSATEVLERLDTFGTHAYVSSILDRNGRERDRSEIAIEAAN